MSRTASTLAPCSVRGWLRADRASGRHSALMSTSIHYLLNLLRDSFLWPLMNQKQVLLCSKKRRIRTIQIHSDIISYFNE